jgi:hypothetical protein
VDYASTGVANQTLLELETPLKQNVQAIVILEDVTEVFDKGSAWLP